MMRKAGLAIGIVYGALVVAMWFCVMACAVCVLGAVVGCLIGQSSLAVARFVLPHTPLLSAEAVRSGFDSLSAGLGAVAGAGLFARWFWGELRRPPLSRAGSST